MGWIVDNLLPETFLKSYQIGEVFLLIGFFYTIKRVFKTLWNLHEAFKTFILPLFWPINFPEEYGSWAVVTGCSKGIGLNYAHELAKKGMNLVLVARKEKLLNEIADDIKSKYGVEVDVIIADFGKGNDIYKNIEESLVDKDIGILVNNVGVAGVMQYFHEDSEENMRNMINVNICSMTMMTKMILPGMIRKKRGAIINLSSLGGIAPSPFMTMYCATKAYIDFFSRGLAYECNDKGVLIQCVCPGPVFTDMLTKLIITKDKPYAVMPTSEVFAKQALNTLGFSAYRTAGYWAHSLIIKSGILHFTELQKKKNLKQVAAALEQDKSS